MVEDLLYISKELLSYLNSNDSFSEKERKYIISVVNKSIDLVMIELENTEGPKSDIKLQTIKQKS